MKNTRVFHYYNVLVDQQSCFKAIEDIQCNSFFNKTCSTRAFISFLTTIELSWSLLNSNVRPIQRGENKGNSDDTPLSRYLLSWLILKCIQMYYTYTCKNSNGASWVV